MGQCDGITLPGRGTVARSEQLVAELSAQVAERDGDCYLTGGATADVPQ